MLAVLPPAAAATTAPNGPATVLEVDVPFAVRLSPGADPVNEPAAQMRTDIQNMAAVGNKWIRLDVNWAQVEPSPGTFNWTATDNAMGYAIGAGMTVDAMAAYAPAWGLSGGPHAI